MARPLVYLAGRYQPADRAAVSYLSAGFLYGEGVFTTLRLYRGRPWDLPGHLRRLRDNARALDLVCPRELDDLGGILAELARRNGVADTDARARVTLWRGEDPERLLPLTDLERIPVYLGAVVLPLPAELAGWQREGIRVLTLEAGSDRGSLAAVKSICYLPSVLALRRAAAAGCQEALLVDSSDRVLEGATSNVFLVWTDGAIVTPRLGGGLLAGRTRERVIALARGLGIRLDERVVTRGDLQAAREVFLTGSVKEVTPVVAVDDHPVGGGAPGPVTRRLQKVYRQEVATFLAASGGT